jgi:hypothetical protein
VIDPSAVKPWKLTAIVTAILVGFCTAFAAWPPFALDQKITFPRCEGPLRKLVNSNVWRELVERERFENLLARRSSEFRATPWTCIAVDPKERVEGILLPVGEGVTNFERMTPGRMIFDGRVIVGQPSSSPVIGLPDLGKFVHVQDQRLSMFAPPPRLHIVFDGWVSRPDWRPDLRQPAVAQVALVDRLISVRTVSFFEYSDIPAGRAAAPPKSRGVAGAGPG